MPTQRTWILVLMLALVAACSGDSSSTPDGSIVPDALVLSDAVPSPDAKINTIADFDGLWLMASVTIEEGEDVLVLTRDGVPLSLRGDISFTSTSPTTSTLHRRQTLLNAGLLASAVDSDEMELVADADIWLVTNPDSTIVFVPSLIGDKLTLVVDADDPRHTSTDAPLQVVLDRVPPWSTTVVGDWNVTSLVLPDETLTPNVCIEVETGVQWGLFEMVVHFDERLLFERTMTITTYSDAGCTTSIGSQVSTQTGMAEEVGGTSLRMWGVEDGNTEFLDFTLSTSGDSATLDRVHCLPSPACEEDAPVQVVVQRVP